MDNGPDFFGMNVWRGQVKPKTPVVRIAEVGGDLVANIHAVGIAVERDPGRVFQPRAAQCSAKSPKRGPVFDGDSASGFAG